MNCQNSFSSRLPQTFLRKKISLGTCYIILVKEVTQTATLAYFHVNLSYIFSGPE